MKKYLVFIMIFLSQQAMAFDIWVKPQIGYNFNQDKVLQNYFMKDGFVSYGIASDLIFKNKFGLFVDFSAYDFDIEEELFGEIYSNEIKGKWISAGICRNFEFDNLPIIMLPRVGYSFKPTIDTFINESKNISGIYLGFDLDYIINQNVKVGLFGNYRNLSYQYKEWRESTFSRGHYYLNGKKVVEPHFSFGANISIKVW